MTAFALLSTYALFVLDPAIFVPGGGSALLPAALAAPLPQDEGDGSDDSGDTKEPVVLDLDVDKDEAVTIDDFDALVLARENPAKFEEEYGISADKLLESLDVDGDGEHTDIDLAEFGAQGGAALSSNPICDSGPARRWGAQLPVSTHSSANLFKGNLSTVIPIASWPSFGPDMNFALIHNSSRVACADDSFSTGFSLGAGWSITYGGYLWFPSATTLQVVEDNGNVNTFTKSGSNWIAPTGVYDTLAQQTNPFPLTGTYWVLTRKNQWRRICDSGGRLVFHTDSNRDAVAYNHGDDHPLAIWIERDENNRIVAIHDSTKQRTLEFNYLASGRVDYITDYAVLNRKWYFEYDVNDRLANIKMWDSEQTPTLHWTISATYDTAGRINVITDKEGNAFDYDYDASGRI